MRHAVASEAALRPHAIDKRGLVMVCDVDIALPDATRTHTVEVAAGFARAGLDVDLVARGPDPALAGVGYVAAGGSESQRALRLLTINLQSIRLLWARRSRAGRFYVREKWTCLPATLAARALGYHVVTQVDAVPYGPGADSDDGSTPSRVLKRLAAVAMGRLSHGVLAVTPQIRRLLIDLAHVPPERIAVIPNGVDLELFKPLPRPEAIERSQLDPGSRYVVFVGGFYPWADFDTLLAAFALVVAERPEARLLLVGDGPERPLIERRAHYLQIVDSVTITGFVRERERVRDYLGAATITVMAHRRDKVSRTSASPVKLMEYLAAGRAVVSLELPGGREFVEHNHAGVIVPGGAEPLARAMIELLDPERADALGAAGRRFAEQSLSWDSVIDRTLPLFALPAPGG
jgi:glycosyltransferase involved in cell wall biosynthesis